jgi:hypothetical protein
VRLRRPDWATSFEVESGVEEDGWVVIPRRIFSAGARIEIDLRVGMRRVPGRAWNAGRSALAWGPVLLAYDADGDAPDVFDVFESAPRGTVAATAQLPWSVSSAVAPGGRRRATVMPFARAGLEHRASRVWIANRPPEIPLSVFHGATEIRSSGDLTRGSIADYDPMSFAATADADGLAWFGLEAASPVSFRRVIVAHGRSLVHGGWFDRSRGVPTIEVRRSPAEDWTPIGELTGYPFTDETQDAGLAAGQESVLTLDDPVTAVAIRVVGYGSSGEYPREERFATCALLNAYEQ